MPNRLPLLADRIEVVVTRTKGSIHVLVPLYCIFIMLTFLRVDAQEREVRNMELINGHWFNGKTFEPRKYYSVDGILTSRQPVQIDTVVDLTGGYVIPPFAEAHNHNIGTGVNDWDRKAIRKYLGDGVFYVKIQGNLPLSDDGKQSLGINRPNSVDVSFAQGSLTASGGHPTYLVERILLRQGYYPGHTKESLRDFRYFTIDSEADLESKWSQITKVKPDFIKAFLGRSDHFEKTKNDTLVYTKGLDPSLLPGIVAKAHAEKFRVSVHVLNAADFHAAVIAGVDEIAHLPRYASGTPMVPIATRDARLAAKKGIVVVTTAAISLQQHGLVEADVPIARKNHSENLKILSTHGVAIAVGSDDVTDSSVKELFYLKELGVFDNLTLLNMWTGTSAVAIFPDRKIGVLRDGYEASFITLAGNPLEDLNNLREIRLRVKQGTFIKL